MSGADREAVAPMIPSDHEAEKVAAGLTKAQREWLLNPEWHGSGLTQFALVDCLETKFDAKMVTMFTLRWDRLTPLGLRVRAILLSEQSK